MRKRKGIFFFTLFLLLCSVCLAGSRAAAQEQTEEKHVLYFSSYAYDFVTVRDQMKGLEEGLSGHNTDIDYEFMDTKKLSTDSDMKQFHDNLVWKMQQLPAFDAIVLCDDAALQFGMKYQKELFNKIPMIYLGVNDLDLAQRASKDPYIQGIVEVIPYEQNINLMQSLFPDLKEVVALTDNTPTGIGNEKQFRALQEKYPKLRFSVINSSVLTTQDLRQKLQEQKEGSILLYLSLVHDGSGVYYSADDVIRFLADNAKVPVIKTSDGGIGDGIFGGVMLSYEAMGKQAGAMALTAMQYPYVGNTREPYQYCPTFGKFDKNMLDRYHVNASRIPSEYTVINRKLNFFQQNPRITQLFLVSLAAAVLIIVLLIFSTAHSRKLMLTDYLTGLPNRMWITRWMKKLTDDISPFAVILIDLDDFKHINDVMGHTTGDELLIRLTQRFQQMASDESPIARIGGDEFLYVMRGDKEDTILQKVQDLAAIAEEPFQLEHARLNITLSMGIACYPQDALTTEQLMAYADTAMYEVKARGKSGHRFFNETMKKQLDREDHINQELLSAIDHDGFQMVYQPQFCVSDCRLHGFEALLRLKNGMYSPGEFIPVAESRRLIARIDRIMTKKVIEQIAAWRKEEGDQDVRVSINFSNAQIWDSGYPDFLELQLRKNEVPPSCLEIEVTESVYLERSETAQEFLNRLMEIGISLSLDDFGTGYSAINYLHYVPISTIKMDKSMMDQYSETGDSSMIASIIQLAHNLHMCITAEGVEEEQQMRLLCELGCDYIQGFLLGRPEEAAKAQQRIREESVYRKM